MQFEFAHDSESTIEGKKAIYFPASESLYSHDCRTMGYECTVVGQAPPKLDLAGEKRFLIYVDFFRRTAIAKEHELVLCNSDEAPPVQSQGEVVIAWIVPDVEIVGAHRANRWAPFTGFRIRSGAVATLQHQRWPHEDGSDFLLCETPRDLELDVDLAISVLGKIGNQRYWRILPELP